MIHDDITLGALEDALEVIGYPRLAVRRRGGTWEATTSEERPGIWVSGRTLAAAIAAAIEWERARIAARAREEAGAW